MKGWSKVMLAVGLVALLGCTLLACGGGGGSAASTPEGTVRNYLSAMQSKDVERMAACCTGQEKEDILETGQDMFSGVNTIRISNIDIEVVSQSEDEATVEATYHIKMTMEGGTYEDDDSGSADLVKMDGKWYIEYSY